MKNELLFREDGTFSILQFTDIHFSEDNEMDHLTTGLMTRIIREENPDFIMVTGDAVYGPNNAGFLEKALAPVTESGIPWSFTFGNHDTEDGEGYEVLFPLITSLPNCVAFNADDSVSGIGNHVLEVKNRRGKAEWLLFGIDSGTYNQMPHIGGYDFVKEDQIQWYRQTIRDYEHGECEFSTLLFMHMALPEYKTVWDLENCRGGKREGICCPRINSGFFAAMQGAGHMKGVFVGHDHINDFCGELFGITLAYGRATGYNTYGQDGFQKGARIIRLREGNKESFDTWIRLEDGTVDYQQEEHIHEWEREDD